MLRGDFAGVVYGNDSPYAGGIPNGERLMPTLENNTTIGNLASWKACLGAFAFAIIYAPQGLPNKSSRAKT